MEYKRTVGRAVKQFWRARAQQELKQGTLTGVKDTGARAAVTGGRQMDGFVSLFSDVLCSAGLPDSAIHTRQTTLPGYFRPTKDWDLIVVVDGQLLASIEFKAQVGSFGNNFNNRVEEALGSSVDLLTAYREGKFPTSQRPWLGWLMLLEDTEESISPVRAREPHFEVFPEFRDTSYAARYELFCERLVRERLYDAACLLMSNSRDGLRGGYSEPNPELGFGTFAASLLATAIARAKLRD